MRTKRLDARPTRRGGIRRSQLHARLLFVRRSHSRPRIPHDGVSGSIGEALGCSQQNDILLGRARLLSKQNAVGSGVRSWASAHRGYVDAGSGTRARLHQAGDQQDRNGFSRHDRITAFDVTQERGGSQYIQKNQHE